MSINVMGLSNWPAYWKIWDTFSFVLVKVVDKTVLLLPSTSGGIIFWEDLQDVTRWWRSWHDEDFLVVTRCYFAGFASWSSRPPAHMRTDPSPLEQSDFGLGVDPGGTCGITIGRRSVSNDTGDTFETRGEIKTAASRLIMMTINCKFKIEFRNILHMIRFIPVS